MKNALIFACVVLVLGGISYAALQAVKKQDSMAAKQTYEVVHRRLNNGTVVYEERATGPIETIEPAAGGEAPAQSNFRYDPLTQTYRVQTGVDSSGKPRQEIIRQPRNP